MKRLVLLSLIAIAVATLSPSRWFVNGNAAANQASIDQAQVIDDRAPGSNARGENSQTHLKTADKIPDKVSLEAHETNAATSAPQFMSATMTRSSATAMTAWKLPPPLPRAEFNGKSWDLVDSKGRRLNDIPFDTIWDFHDGVALAQMGDQYARLDTEGKLVGGELYQMVFPFSEDLGAAQIHGKWGYLDYAGNWAIRPQYDYAWEFHDGIALVKYNPKGEERLAYINRNGDFLGNQTFEMTYAFTEGLSASKINGKFGYIDRTGGWVIQPQFEEAWQFANGKALVKSSGQLYDIDHHGSMTRHQ